MLLLRNKVLKNLFKYFRSKAVLKGRFATKVKSLSSITLLT